MGIEVKTTGQARAQNHCKSYRSVRFFIPVPSKNFILYHLVAMRRHKNGNIIKTGRHKINITL